MNVCVHVYAVYGCRNSPKKHSIKSLSRNGLARIGFCSRDDNSHVRLEIKGNRGVIYKNNNKFCFSAIRFTKTFFGKDVNCQTEKDECEWVANIDFFSKRKMLRICLRSIRAYFYNFFPPV